MDSDDDVFGGRLFEDEEEKKSDDEEKKSDDEEKKSDGEEKKSDGEEKKSDEEKKGDYGVAHIPDSPPTSPPTSPCRPVTSPSGKPLKILTFIWNTESIRLGESLSQEEIAEHRKGYFAPYQFQCEIPDFFPALLQRVQQTDADLVAIAFQEDCSPASYYHSHLLPAEMPKYGYKMVKRTKMIGVGATTYKALFSFDLKMRGLRISIYAKTALAEAILTEESTLITDIGMTQKEYVCSSMFLRNKGATASYIRVPNVGTIAFINVHLTF